MNTKIVYRTMYDAMGNEEPDKQAVTLYERSYYQPNKIMHTIINIVLAVFVLALLSGMVYGMSIILKG